MKPVPFWFLRTQDTLANRVRGSWLALIQGAGLLDVERSLAVRVRHDPLIFAEGGRDL